MNPLPRILYFAALLFAVTGLSAEEDTYHQWVRNQLQTEHGITGGSWVTGETEDEAFSRSWFPEGVSKEDAQVENQPFTKAFRVSNQVRPENFWDHSIHFASHTTIAKHDVLLLTVWIRGIEGERGKGFVNHTFELGEAPWSNAYQQRAASPSEWQQWLVPFEANVDMPLSWYKIHMGFQKQTFEVGGVAILNYGNSYTVEDLPKTYHPLSYDGRSLDAAWRADAQQRIEQHRMADLTVKVVDTEGNPIKGASVAIRMKKHSFGFGTSIYVPERAVGQFKHTKEELDAYYHNFEDLTGDGRGFNWAVIDDELRWNTWENPYWSPWQAAAGQTNTLNHFDWLKARGVQVRGHMLVWPAFEWLPTDIEANKANPTYIRNRITNHINTLVGHPRLKGKVVDWNVINEPAHLTELADVFGGTAEYAEWFKLAAAADPNAKLYINEYDILSGGGMNIAIQDKYKEIINSIDQNGGRVDGVGLESHVGYPLAGPELVYEIIDEYAQLGDGKEISISEYDARGLLEPVGGEYLRDFLTITFSHPAVKSFLFWGYWDKNHWLDDAPIFREDWSKKPSGEAFIDLVFTQWWTRENRLSNDDGLVTTRGFLGDYTITAAAQGLAKAESITLDRETDTVVITIGSGETFFFPKLELASSGSAESFTVTWKMESGITYTVEESPNLKPGSWKTVSEVPVIEAMMASITLPYPKNGTSLYYRVNIQTE